MDPLINQRLHQSLTLPDTPHYSIFKWKPTDSAYKVVSVRAPANYAITKVVSCRFKDGDCESHETKRRLSELLIGKQVENIYKKDISFEIPSEITVTVRSESFRNIDHKSGVYNNFVFDTDAFGHWNRYLDPMQYPSDVTLEFRNERLTKKFDIGYCYDTMTARDAKTVDLVWNSKCRTEFEDITVTREEFIEQHKFYDDEYEFKTLLFSGSMFDCEPEKYFPFAHIFGESERERLYMRTRVYMIVITNYGKIFCLTYFPGQDCVYLGSLSLRMRLVERIWLIADHNKRIDGAGELPMFSPSIAHRTVIPREILETLDISDAYRIFKREISEYAHKLDNLEKKCAELAHRVRELESEKGEKIE